MYDIQAVSVNVKYGEYTIEDSNVIIAVFTSSVYSKNKQIRKSVLSEIRKKYPQKLPVVFITLNFEDVEVEFLDKKNEKESIKEIFINLGKEYWKNYILEHKYSFSYAPI